MKSFLLIGAGNFGHLLARELSKQPCELMIADISEHALEDLLELGISAKIGDCKREEVLESFDVASFDACFVCVGGHFQTSLEIVYLLKKLHAAKIYCRADDDSQARFLGIIGADHVIYPEREAAQSLAVSEANDSIFNCISMTEGYSVYEIATPASWVNKTISEANIYQVYRINILAIVKNGVIFMMPPSSYQLNANDHLMVLGHQADIEKLK